MAFGTLDRETGHRYRSAPSRVPLVLDLENSARTARSATGFERKTRTSYKVAARRAMKKLILLIILIVTFGTVAPAQRGRPAPFTGPVADLVNGIVNAINKQDMAYIQKVVAADAMWADGDIHVLPASFFIGRLLQGNPPKKLA